MCAICRGSFLPILVFDMGMMVFVRDGEFVQCFALPSPVAGQHADEEGEEDDRDGAEGDCGYDTWGNVARSFGGGGGGGRR